MTPVVIFLSLFAAVIALALFQQRQQRAHESFIDGYTLPAGIRQKVHKRYTHLTEAQPVPCAASARWGTSTPRHSVASERSARHTLRARSFRLVLPYRSSFGFRLLSRWPAVPVHVTPAT